ncbi:hypothetical protein MRX96_000546 [Rhipicephalus microplus]
MRRDHLRIVSRSCPAGRAVMSSEACAGDWMPMKEANVPTHDRDVPHLVGRHHPGVRKSVEELNWSVEPKPVASSEVGYV